MAVKTLAALARFLEELAGNDNGFLLVHDEAIAERIGKLAEELENLEAKWDALSTEQKAVEEAKLASWRKRRDRDGEYVDASLTPSLKELLKKKGGKAYLENYVYYMTRSGKWILRFERGGSNGRGKA